MVIHPGSSAKSFCQILSSYHHRDQAFPSSSSLPSQTKSIFVASPSHTELKQFLAERISPNFNRFDVGESELTSTFASLSADNNSNLSAEKEPVGGGGLEQVGNLTRAIVVIIVISTITIIIFVVATMCRESEERERATLKREEKKKEGDPLEEVDILVIVVVGGWFLVVVIFLRR